ncbi:flagellar basal body rod protein FlgC [Campylobacter hyointestinalis]|uniref:Flagellar basal-body rod protein FlgC n=1 Tax=Campylobacter hyointestinalis subsp. hyointestinalis TaxID=91352 RepID=A0A9W5AL75_CAMHY|nr:flagellar basal body rod protein FlgC [Campylobacter hyointestinalis]KEA44934.1 flagellar basal body rod protein FlgC [Campylobacter hyointestinalis subsp. hyointestinalis]MBT0611657.1 flagellar basal body rod protein FlgC [Campylobacter hyointestinalis subsp. hyointestinalis]MDL2346671.1 flagellar basal body rod protein FlgC [Campylobacter hyointestinalis]MDL2348718.1 flagellar basal body rod protein FlgC [Campylobacter hyointestinalis]MDL2350156.1 flagellar basal body rod protein FlgC [Ca
MAYLSDFDISGYGLSAQRFRMNVISSNIANANTTRTAEGGPYRRREVIFKAIDFDKQLNNTINSKNDFLQNENPLDDPDAPDFPKPALMSVIVDKVVRDDKDFKLKFDPNHPDADAKGYIMLPNINPVIEMADLIEATRAYQANVSAFQSAKTIANSAIDMLK